MNNKLKTFFLKTIVGTIFVLFVIIMLQTWKINYNAGFTGDIITILGIYLMLYNIA